MTTTSSRKQRLLNRKITRNSMLSSRDIRLPQKSKEVRYYLAELAF